MNPSHANFAKILGTSNGVALGTNVSIASLTALVTNLKTAPDQRPTLCTFMGNAPHQTAWSVSPVLKRVTSTKTVNITTATTATAEPPVISHAIVPATPVAFNFYNAPIIATNNKISLIIWKTQTMGNTMSTLMTTWMENVKSKNGISTPYEGDNVMVHLLQHHIPCAQFIFTLFYSCFFIVPLHSMMFHYVLHYSIRPIYRL